MEEEGYGGSDYDDSDGECYPPSSKKQKLHHDVDYNGFVSVYDLDSGTEVLEERPASLATIERSSNGPFLNPAIETDYVSELGKCPICLENLDNPSIPNNCPHQFCFICIVHWSSTTQACPMCKRSFEFILHNIKSASEYKRYYPKDPVHSNKPPPTSITSRSVPRPIPATHKVQPITQREAPPPPLFLTDAHALRRAVYARGLKVKAPSTQPYLSPQTLKSKPEFIQRLRPWITRDLQAILQIEETSLLVELVISLLKKFDTRKDIQDLHKHLREILPMEYIDTFLKELLCFASSKHPNMTVYDKHVQYDKTKP